LSAGQHNRERATRGQRASTPTRHGMACLSSVMGHPQKNNQKKTTNPDVNRFTRHAACPETELAAGVGGCVLEAPVSSAYRFTRERIVVPLGSSEWHESEPGANGRGHLCVTGIVNAETRRAGNAHWTLVGWFGASAANGHRLHFGAATLRSGTDGNGTPRLAACWTAGERARVAPGTPAAAEQWTLVRWLGVAAANGNCVHGSNSPIDAYDRRVKDARLGHDF
jgi:hypothetical protein